MAKLTFHCSYCDFNATFSHHRIRVDKQLYNEIDGTITRYTHFIGICDQCRRVMYFVFKIGPELTTKSNRTNTIYVVEDRNYDSETPDEELARLLKDYTIDEHYPKRNYELHQAVPQEVGKYLIEAYRCFDNRAFNASAAMSRRAIQKTCKKLGAKKTILQDQIDEVMPQELKDYAHETRLWGNIGAHPDDEIEDVVEEDALSLTEFIEHIFDYVFIMPFKRQQSLARRTK